MPEEDETTPIATWPAVYLDGEPPLRQVATVRLSAQGIAIERPGAIPIAWEWRDVEAFGEGATTQLERPRESRELLLIEQPGFRDALESFRKSLKLRRLLTRPPGWLLGAGAVVALTLVTLFVVRGVPAISDLAARLLPVSWEERIGEVVLDGFASPDQRCEDPVVRSALKRVTDRLAAALGPTPYTLDVVLDKDPQINAFALPGGHIVVMQGLLERTESPEELAGVLAHEIQHVKHRHPTSALLKNLSLSLLSAAVLGDTRLADAAKTLAELHYDRNLEAEADRDGLALMQAAGLDGEAMVDAFRMLSREAPDVPHALRFLSNHPETEARIQDLETRLHHAPSTGPPIALDEPWATTVKRCKEQAPETSHDSQP